VKGAHKRKLFLPNAVGQRRGQPALPEKQERLWSALGGRGAGVPLKHCLEQRLYVIMDKAQLSRQGLYPSPRDGHHAGSQGTHQRLCKV